MMYDRLASVSELIEDLKKETDLNHRADKAIAQSIVNHIFNNIDALRAGETIVFKLGVYRDMGNVRRRWNEKWTIHRDALVGKGYKVELSENLHEPVLRISIK